MSSCPRGIETVADLLALAARRAARSMSTRCSIPTSIRVAIDQEHVEHRETIAGAREIALFPPMTGG